MTRFYYLGNSVPGVTAGIHAALVEGLNHDINRVLKLPDLAHGSGRRLAGGRHTGTPAQFGQLVRSELEKWWRIIRQAGIVPDAR